MQKSSFLVYSSFVILFTLSCYTRKEACLDTYATNYDVSADDQCDNGCCTYPGLMVEVEKKAGDSLFMVNDTLVNSLGQKFRILDLRCYFSDFSLFQNQGIKTKIIELISNSDKSVIIPDDMKIWRWADPAFSVGTVKIYGRLDSLIFYLGLNSVMNNTTFTNLPSTHSLLTENALKDEAGNVVFMTLRCVRFFNKSDTINISISKSNSPFKFAISKPITTQKGDDILYKLKADYHVLMKDVDLKLPVSSIENGIKNNINSFISVN